MKTLFTRLVLAACSMLTLGNYVQAAVVSFGSGTNQFNIEFVTIGNPGNAADTTGAPSPAGKVDYVYGIGKYEVSRGVIAKYNADFGITNSLEIGLWDMTAFGGNGINRPATGVSWNDAARFVNWLNYSTGNSVAYNFTTGGVNDNITPWSPANILDYDPLNPFRSKRARFVLPSYNEWYKAAYYDPANGVYYDYPTGSDTAPVSVESGTSSGTAVFNHGLFHGPADVDQAGGLSPYGVMGLGGNAFEWEESTFDVSLGNYNTSGSSARGFRGGDWIFSTKFFLASSRYDISPTFESDCFLGFRVAMVTPSGGEVPEPSTMAIFGLGALGMAYRARRKAMA